MGNNLATVQSVLAALDAHGVRCWLFGGWAEEVRGLRAPGEHRDIDLLFPAPGFADFDRLLAEDLPEVIGKRLPHKRAFLAGTVLVEAFLVSRDEDGLHTLFWGHCRHDWPSDTLRCPAGFEWPVASEAALTGYRRDHQRLMVAPTGAGPAPVD